MRLFSWLLQLCASRVTSFAGMARSCDSASAPKTCCDPANCFDIERTASIDAVVCPALIADFVRRCSCGLDDPASWLLSSTFLLHRCSIFLRACVSGIVHRSCLLPGRTYLPANHAVGWAERSEAQHGQFPLHPLGFALLSPAYGSGG
jgi:hypothetical protein